MSENGVISSRQNPRVQALARLRERRERDERRLFIVEGRRELSRAIAAAATLETIYFCPALYKDAAASRALTDNAARRGIALCELGASAFEKVSGREGADGLIGVAAMWDTSPERLKLPDVPLLLVVEALEKPGNLGALMRTADSAGCSALICCDPVVDIFNPAVVRASQGALFAVPCATGLATDVAAYLARHGVNIFAAAPAAETRYWDADFRGPCALLLGSEKDGLSPFWLDAAAPRRARAIGIPQAGLSDSLNVATAGAICLYEAVRQRATGLGPRHETAKTKAEN